LEENETTPHSPLLHSEDPKLQSKRGSVLSPLGQFNKLSSSLFPRSNSSPKIPPLTDPDKQNNSLSQSDHDAHTHTPPLTIITSSPLAPSVEPPKVQGAGDGIEETFYLPIVPLYPTSNDNKNTKTTAKSRSLPTTPVGKRKISSPSPTNELRSEEFEHGKLTPSKHKRSFEKVAQDVISPPTRFHTRQSDQQFQDILPSTPRPPRSQSAEESSTSSSAPSSNPNPNSRSVNRRASDSTGPIKVSTRSKLSLPTSPEKDQTKQVESLKGSFRALKEQHVQQLQQFNVSKNHDQL